MNGVIQENLTGIRLIRVFVRMGHEIERFAGFSGKLMKGTISALRLTETTMPFMLLMMNGCIIAVLWFGRLDIASGSATVGEVVAVINYLLRTIGAMSALSWILVTFSRASASAQRLNEVFETEDTSETERTGQSSLTGHITQIRENGKSDQTGQVVWMEEHSKNGQTGKIGQRDQSESEKAPVGVSERGTEHADLPSSIHHRSESSGAGSTRKEHNSRTVQGAVEFRKVGFSYPGSEIKVLEDISFSARAGERIAIMGATGSGKSSLVQLIPRLYTEEQGQVRIDGADASALDLPTLRGSIGYVPQEVILFTGSVRENIAWGREDASMEEILEAARRAQIHETIEQLPNGYDTLLGQRGVNLSGGQKQRLSIARALVRRPSILILDDSTSALDVATEARLLDALEELSCTTFIITQKISSTASADLILLLDDGRLIGQGKHEDLMESSELYRRIYESQYGRVRSMFKAFIEPFRQPRPALDPESLRSGKGRKPKARAKNWSGTLGRIWSYLARRKVKLSLVLLMVLASSGLALLGPYMVGVAVDQFIAGEATSSSWITFLLGLTAVYVLFSLTSWLQNIWMIEIAQETVFRMRYDLFSHLHKLPIPFFGKRQQGEIMSRVTNDIENVSSTLNSSAIQIFRVY